MIRATISKPLPGFSYISRPLCVKGGGGGGVQVLILGIRVYL